MSKLKERARTADKPSTESESKNKRIDSAMGDDVDTNLNADLLG